MITFQELEYKNFLAAGNNPIKIQLNRNRNTLIVGSNGSGKSTILDALSFALFGKAHRSVPKNNLINSVNGKHCVVSVTFETSGNTFKIVRGIKPNIFEVWQNGKMIDQSASVRDYQKFLEQNILKLNHKSFHQIVVLGSSSFIPFMQLNSKVRREVVEDLLDINIFSRMKKILKERNTTEKKNSLAEHNNLNVWKSKHEYQEKYVKKMEKINAEAKIDNESAIQDLQDTIDDLITQGIDLSGKAKEFDSDLDGKLHDVTNLIYDTNRVINKIGKDMTFYSDNDNCPTCIQPITAEFKTEMMMGLKEQRDGLETQLPNLSNQKDEIDKRLAALNEITDSLSTIQQTIEFNKTSMSTLKHKVKYQELTSALKDLSDLRVKADECRDALDECNTKLLYNDIAAEMLKDTGIRTKVIREYLPAMNVLINQYLQTLEFFVAFTLDENFDETIRSRHRDQFKYDNFSEGEKQRIDLSLLFTWRQIAKMKNSTNTNLLILDETFDSSLDVDGVDNLMKILHSLGKETNTFVISHKGDVLSNSFPNRIEFQKTSNFSKIV